MLRFTLLVFSGLVLFSFDVTSVHAQTVTLVDAEGFDWDIDQDDYGYISDGGSDSMGLSDSYDSWNRLCVTTRVTATDACTTDERYQATDAAMMITSGREFRMQTQTVVGLDVYRRIYVPETGIGFARYIEVLHNPGASPITVKVRVGQTYAFGGDWGSDSGTQLPATSDGVGTALRAGLSWFTSDDGNTSGGDPSLGHVMSGTGGEATSALVYDPFGASLTSDEVYWEYGPVTIAPGDTVAYMHFAVQQANQTAAQARSTALVATPAEAIVGIEGALRFQIRNFLLGDPSNCGNGTIDAGEQCDDGNMDPTDTCTDVCLDARCGDGYVQTGVEECDDANGVADDGCTNECRFPICGDGIIHDGEECDEGVDNSDTVADACRTTCVEATCPDGAVDTGEACDDGNDVDDDACSNTCTMPMCGDGIIQAGVGEECDDGNTFARDACTDTCLNARCGDGIVRVGVEQCDDGNDVDDDDCSNSCVAVRCGDGVVAGSEECDDGDDNSDTDADACRTSCREATCGDGVMDSGETCDDGNLLDTDTCTSSCVPAECGDGIVQETELCDDGEENGIEVGKCTTDCDGFVRPGGSDAGADPDAGSEDDAGEMDAGVMPDASSPDAGGTSGGGCSSTGGGATMPWLLGLLFVSRRRRRRGGIEA